MKIQKFILSLICLLALISSANSLANTVEQDIHANAQYSKAVTLENGNVLVISSEDGTPQITHIAELDKDGRILYSNSKISRGISPDAQLIQQKNGGLFFLSHHKGKNQMVTNAWPGRGIYSIFRGCIVICHSCSPLYYLN